MKRLETHTTQWIFFSEGWEMSFLLTHLLLLSCCDFSGCLFWLSYPQSFNGAAHYFASDFIKFSRFPMFSSPFVVSKVSRNVSFIVCWHILCNLHLVLYIILLLYSYRYHLTENKVGSFTVVRITDFFNWKFGKRSCHRTEKVAGYHVVVAKLCEPIGCFAGIPNPMHPACH